MSAFALYTIGFLGSCVLALSFFPLSCFLLLASCFYLILLELQRFSEEMLYDERTGY
ncbi:MAG: hypothetical protein AB1765_11535 [Candidatus Hydrogenedentota bacterium]